MQIRYDLIQKSRMVLEMCAAFLAEVFNQSKNDELFQGAFWVHLKRF